MNKNPLTKMAALCFGAMILLSSPITAKASQLVYNFTTSRMAGTTKATGTFNVHLFETYMGLGANDRSDLHLEGYVSDSNEAIGSGGHYTFFTGASDTTSIGQTRETSFPAQYGRCDYSVSSYDGDADFAIWYNNNVTPNWGN